MFRVQEGMRRSPSQRIRIAYQGVRPVEWTAVSSASWLTMNPMTGTIASRRPDMAVVMVNASGMPTGTVTGTLTITTPTSGSSAASSATVAVTMVVVSPPALSLHVSPTSLVFNLGAQPTGAKKGASRRINLSSRGGMLSWTAASSASWLSINPASGTLRGLRPMPAMVSIDASSVPTGTITGTITISAPGAVNSPVTVNVTVNNSGS